VMTGKWPRVWRPFSVACAPGPGQDRIQLHVRHIPGGWVSTALIRDTGVPDEVIIGPPVGTMTAEAANGHDMLLVAGGVGLAPMMALAEDVLTRDEQAMAGGWGRRRRIALFHGARDALGLYEMPRLRELERSYPWLQVEPVVSDDPGFHGRQGMVSDAVLEEQWPGRDAFLAGPPQMIEKVACGLAERGVDEDRVHFDPPEAR
jgi:NAD(P)H-flavin reductase